MDIVWDRIDRRGWEAATATLALPMQQHWTYGGVLAALGRQVARAEIFASGRRIGLAQMVCRPFGPFRMTLVSRGPLWLDKVAPEVAREAHRALARDSGLMIATPESGQAGRGLIPLLTPRHRAVVDLRPDLDRVRARIAGKWRNRLVRAERAGMVLCQGCPTEAALAGVLGIEAAQQHQRRYRALPPAFTLGWLRADPEGVVLYEACHGGRTVATMLILLHRPTASYHIGWSNAEGRRLGAHQLLLWQAIRDLKARGLTALDLGDVNTEDAPGLARFKIGSGAKVAPLGATMLVLPAFTLRRP